MPILNPETQISVVTSTEIVAYFAVDYVHVIILSLWAGISRYYQSCRQFGIDCRFGDGIVEVITSIYVGILAFFALEYLQTDRILSAVILSVAAYSGVDLLVLADKYMKKHINSKFGGKDD